MWDEYYEELRKQSFKVAELLGESKGILRILLKGRMSIGNREMVEEFLDRGKVQFPLRKSNG